MVDLDGLYKQIPGFKCIDGCTDCCGAVPVNKEEAERIGKRPELVEDKNGIGICEFAVNGPCSIYENRPLACRIYGTDLSDPFCRCPHGCKPLFPLSKEQANDITDQYLKTLESGK